MGGRFEGIVAVVTGAGSGIGRATAVLLASEGAEVGCLDVDRAGLSETVETIRAEGGGAMSQHCDVSGATSVEAAMEAVQEAYGVPWVVCNVAGVGGFAHSESAQVDQWERVLSVNLTGTFLVARAGLSRWCADERLKGGALNRGARRRAAPEDRLRRPVVVNVASTAGLMGQPYSAAYAASKGGVAALTKALAVEYLEWGFRINAVAPGGVETPMISSFAFPEDASMPLCERMMSPFGFTKPESVAGAIAYMASDDADYMTGSILAFDAGLTA